VHHFQDVVTSTVYVTACNLEKFGPSVLIQQLKLLVKYTFQFVHRHTVVNTMCYISGGMGVQSKITGIGTI